MRLSAKCYTVEKKPRIFLLCAGEQVVLVFFVFCFCFFPLEAMCMVPGDLVLMSLVIVALKSRSPRFGKQARFSSFHWCYECLYLCVFRNVLKKH